MLPFSRNTLLHLQELSNSVGSQLMDIWQKCSHPSTPTPPHGAPLHNNRPQHPPLHRPPPYHHQHRNTYNSYHGNHGGLIPPPPHHGGGGRGHPFNQRYHPHPRGGYGGGFGGGYRGGYRGEEGGGYRR